MLLGFQKQNILDSESSEGELVESDDDDVKVVSKMKSPSEFVRVMTLGNIKRAIYPYFLQESKL